MKIKNILYLILFILLSNKIFGQLPYQLVDARDGNVCKSFKEIISNKPDEVLFGIDIKPDGSIYFSLNNALWFDKIFISNSYGVTVDLVSKKKYSCKNTSKKDNYFSLPKGKIIFPTYRNDLLKNKEKGNQDYIYVRIGQVPLELRQSQLEGNLIIVNGNNICYYSNFVNIDRNVLQLLPMGLFADSLILNNKTNASKSTDFFTYSRKIPLTIPFEKGSVKFDKEFLYRFYDSIGINNYSIKKVEVRAYSSVEGSEKINKDLMKKRASIVIEAMKKYQPTIPRVNIITAENWVDFFTDISNTRFSGFKEISKLEIKKKLVDNFILKELEPKLSKERKAIVVIYIETKSPLSITKETQLISDFKIAISEKKITKAAGIQTELLKRISDNKLPINYLSKLEVPKTKEFTSLLINKEVYKYLLKTTSEYEALDNFLKIQKLEPKNGKVNYNICALQLFMWQNVNDTSDKKILLQEILELPKQNINNILVKRLIINYNLLKCEEDMHKFNYKAKDSSLNYIRSIYKGIILNDEDIYALAKYFTYYSHGEWAEEIILPRVDKIDVNEDLIFYYVNLQFYKPRVYHSGNFQKSLLNAINLNSKRFCNFFFPYDKGGASMQLLDYSELKEKYCETCRQQ